MAYCKTVAYVLKKVDYSNTSQIVTLYTRDFGKMDAIARGSRRLVKRPIDALDMFVRYEIVFLQRPFARLRTLTEWTAQCRPRGLSTRLDRMYAAAYATELLCEMTEQNDPQTRMFELFDEALATLAQSERLTAILTAFSLNLLHEAGYALVLQRCAACNRPLGTQPRARLSPSDGGILCSACPPRSHAQVWLSAGAIATMRHLADVPLGKAARVGIAPKTEREIRSALHAYIACILGKELKLWRHL